MNTIPIDAAWRRTNPLPEIAGGGDKESRGRVLIVGGSRLVPGALRLTVGPQADLDAVDDLAQRLPEILEQARSAGMAF